LNDNIDTSSIEKMQVSPVRISGTTLFQTKNDIAMYGFDTEPKLDLILSIVIPVYNERETLPRILRACVLALPQVQKEIVIVDDGSKDGTREWLLGTFPSRDAILRGVLRTKDGTVQFLSETDGSTADSWETLEKSVRVRVILQKNQGKGGALRTGFASSTGDVIVIQDADLEYDPSDWAPMMRLIQVGVADVVYGARFYGRPHRCLYMYHMLGNKIITYLFNLLFDQTLTDIETCYKMFRRNVLDGINLVSNDFGIEVELSAVLAGSKRWRVYETGINYYGRSYMEGKKIGWRDGLKALWYVVKFRLR
jgi:glycosyltransferase involved in cell wall biosynthesis